MHSFLRFKINLRTAVVSLCFFSLSFSVSAQNIDEKKSKDGAASNSAQSLVGAPTATWSSNKFNLVDQMAAELDEVYYPLGWIEFVTAHAGRLKALQVGWEDFQTALDSSGTYGGVSHADSQFKAQYEKILAEAKEIAVVDFNRPQNRSFETLTTKIWAVHSTDYFPDNKIALTPVSTYFRPTIHFALGGLVRGHHNYSWEKRQFAVLVPLKELLPQLLNLMPQDSFIAGDFELPASAIVLVPSRFAEKYKDKLTKARLQVYDEQKQTLRMAINATLKDHGAWQIKSHVDNTTMLPRAYVDGVNIYQVPFFSEIAKRYPKLRFGSHVISIVERPTYAGIADNIDVFISLSSSVPNDLSNAIVSYFSEGLKGLLGQIDETVQDESMKVSLWQRYEKVKPRHQSSFFDLFRPPPVAIADKTYFEIQAGHFLNGFDFETAEKIILSMDEKSGLLSKTERLLKQKLARLMLMDLSSGPNPGIGFGSVKGILQELSKTPNGFLAADLIMRESSSNHENAISFFARKDFGSYHILVKWLGFFEQTGFLDKLKKENFKRIPAVKNDLACIEASPNGAQLINVKNGWEIGARFANMQYCQQAIADSTANLVCSVGSTHLHMYIHSTYPMPLGILRFVDLSACGRLLSSVLK